MKSDRLSILLSFVLLLGLAPLSNGQGFDALDQKQVTPSLVADTTAHRRWQAVHHRRAISNRAWLAYLLGVPRRVGGAAEHRMGAAGGIQGRPHSMAAFRTNARRMKLVTNIYENDVVCRWRSLRRRNCRTEEIAIKAHLKWLVCEKLCVPGHGDAGSDISRQAAMPRLQMPSFSRNGERSSQRGTGAPFAAKWDLSKADEFSLQIDGVPEDAKIDFIPLPPKGVKPEHRESEAPSADTSLHYYCPDERGRSAESRMAGVLVIEKGLMEPEKDGRYLLRDKARESRLLPAMRNRRARRFRTPPAAAARPRRLRLPATFCSSCSRHFSAG